MIEENNDLIENKIMVKVLNYTEGNVFIFI